LFTLVMEVLTLILQHNVNEDGALKFHKSVRIFGLLIFALRMIYSCFPGETWLRLCVLCVL
jgi:hypothetical protein